MKLLSVDPGNAEAGWSYFKDSKLFEFGHLSGTPAKHRSAKYKTVNKVKHLVAKAMKLSDSVPITAFQTGEIINKYHEDGCRLLVIEDQFVGSNPYTAIKIVEARMRWAVLAEMLGWEVIRVKPSTWQSKMVSSSPTVTKKDLFTRKAKSKPQIAKEKRENGKALKLRIIERAKIDHPGIVATSDESDSICMGTNYINEQRQRLF